MPWAKQLKKLMRLLLSVLLNQANSSLPIPALSLVEVSYSKAFKKEAEILKIESFNITKSPNRWRYSRYEEA
jgi:hypothetical protein